MKKQGVPVLVAVTLLFAGFTLGFFLGRLRSPAPVSISLPASMQTVPAQTEALPEQTVPEPTVSFPIDINLAPKEDLMALPGIGEVLAQRIVAHRETFGSFLRAEDLMQIEDIGPKRFEEIADLITIGG